MGIFDVFRKQAVAVETKESRIGASLVMNGGQAVWTPRDYKSFSKEAYQQNVVAYRSVGRIADAVASVEWAVSRGETELSGHPILELLSRPNPQQSGPEFMAEMVSYYMLAGNAYTERVDVGGQPKELYQLRPDRMTIVPSANGAPNAFVYTGPNGTKTKFSADDDEIWHMKAFNPVNDWYGQSPVEAGAYAVDQSNEAMRWMQALLQNSARPSGAMVLADDATLSDEAFNRLKAQIEEQYSGSANAGRPMLLEGGLTWQQMGMSPSDMATLETKLSAARDIALAFGVPRSFWAFQAITPIQTMPRRVWRSGKTQCCR